MKYVRYVGFVKLLAIVQKTACSTNILSSKGGTLDEGQLDECNTVKG